MLIVILLPTLLLFPRQTGAEHTPYDCDVSPFNICNTTWLVAYAEADIFLPEEKFLDENCWSMTPFARCLKEYAQFCADAENRSSIIVTYTGFAQTAQMLCDKNSTLRTAYLDYASCLNRKETEVLMPIYSFKEKLLTFEEYYLNGTDLPADVDDAFTCFEFMLLGEKILNESNTNCEDEVPELAPGVIRTFFNDLMEQCPVNESDVEKFSKAYERFDQELEKKMSGALASLQIGNDNPQNASSNVVVTLEEACPNKWEEEYRRSDLIVPDTEFLDKHCREILSYVDCVNGFYSSNGNVHDDRKQNISSIIGVLHKVCRKEKDILLEYTKVEGCINRLRNDLAAVRMMASGLSMRVELYYERQLLSDNPNRTTSEGLPCVLATTSSGDTYDFYNNMKEYCGEEVQSFANGFFPKILRLTTGKCEPFDDGWHKVIGTTIIDVNDNITTRWKCLPDMVVPHPLPWIKGYFRGQIIPSIEYLDNICNDMMPDFNRLMTYNDTCSNLDYIRVFRGTPIVWESTPIVTLNVLRELFQRLCNLKSPLRIDYNKHAGCLSNYQASIKDLLDKASLDIKQFWMYNKPVFKFLDQETQALYCVLRSVYQSRFLDFAKEKCGSESSNYFKGLLNVVFRPSAEYCPDDEHLQKISKQYVKYKLELLEKDM